MSSLRSRQSSIRIGHVVSPAASDDTLLAVPDADHLHPQEFHGRMTRIRLKALMAA
nr:hypothetical protein [Mesorhizobium sp. LSJC277A00]